MTNTPGLVQRAIQSANRYCAKQINSKSFLAKSWGYTLSMLFKLSLFIWGFLLPGALITALTLLTFFTLTPIIGPLSGLVGLGVSLILTITYIKAISPLFKDIFELSAHQAPETKDSTPDSTLIKNSMTQSEKPDLKATKQPLKPAVTCVSIPDKVSSISVFKQPKNEEPNADSVASNALSLF